jgi:hypothetical protein
LRLDRSEVRDLQEEQVIPLLVAFVYSLAYLKGGIKWPKDLLASTLTRNLSAAVIWLKTVLHLEANTYMTNGIMHPMLADIIAQHCTWQCPRERREPHTYKMFAILVDQVHIAAKQKKSATLGLKAAILNWTRLGTFTGSRIAEVAQT